MLAFSSSLLVSTDCLSKASETRLLRIMSITRCSFGSFSLSTLTIRVSAGAVSSSLSLRNS